MAISYTALNENPTCEEHHIIQVGDILYVNINVVALRANPVGLDTFRLTRIEILDLERNSSNALVVSNQLISPSNVSFKIEAISIGRFRMRVLLEAEVDRIVRDCIIKVVA